ncbi:MAG TPA: methyltransferase domain-containing protein [bacterium]|nr:methyltransferase domain-containing protein [bacterium]
MGIRLKTIKYFEEITDILGYKTFKNLRLCQLGDSKVRQCARKYLYYKNHEKSYHKGSKYFEDLGFKVITIDLGVGAEAVADTVLKLDLSKPMIGPIKPFDFIIDFGTGEHIDNQFELFRNINNLCKPGGLILRCNPSDRFGEAHGHGYTFAFYLELSKLCGYKIIDVRETDPAYQIDQNTPLYRNHLYAAMVKTEHWDFTEDEFSKAEKTIKKRESFPRLVFHKQSMREKRGE